jgi:hypothetical protein
MDQAPLRDGQGRRIPDAYELDAMARAAERDAGVRLDTPRDILYRAAGQDPRSSVDEAAVAAELEARRGRGQDAGGDVKAQLEVLHTHTPGLVLDFTRNVVGSDGRVRTLDDHNAISEFTNRLKVETAIRDQGPGSGVASWRDGRWQGDPDVVARVEAAEAERARQLAAMQARQDAAAIKFAGPYNIFNSVK